MNHHTEDTYCPLCVEKLEGCDPELRTIFAQVKSHFPDCHISWGYRDKSAQDAFYKAGKTKERWPLSAHNVLKLGKPCSRAFDLFKLDEMGEAVFERPYYLEIAQFLNEEDIIWSGNWKNFKESNHFELKGGVSSRHQKF